MLISINYLKKLKEVFMKSNYKDKDLYIQYISDAINLLSKQDVELKRLIGIESEYIKLKDLEKESEILFDKIKNIAIIIIAISVFLIVLLIASSIAMSLIKLLIWIINI